ncbi:MAG: PorP/SprF family type IX secretion system membrane protein, partial [Flavobacteriaceae bacterium]
MKLLKYILPLLLAIQALTTTVQAQQDDPILPYRVAPQNLLKFNRFLINPTFSTVREDKSYVNLLHRNQSVQFQDNDQTYFLSYSGRIGDRSGLGLSLYSKKIGPIQNIGILANYAYGIKLSDKSNFTFGGNLAYYSTGLNRNNVDVIDTNDFLLNGTEDSNILSFQPGFNLSYGKFDFGAYAENLIEYNLKTSKSLSDFGDKAYS